MYGGKTLNNPSVTALTFSAKLRLIEVIKAQHSKAKQEQQQWTGLNLQRGIRTVKN